MSVDGEGTGREERWPRDLPEGWARQPVRQMDALELLRELRRDDVLPDLIVVDPPFGIQRILTGRRTSADRPAPAFVDRWPAGLDGYLDWMDRLLEEIASTLAPEGSLLLHCDQHASPYLAVLADRHLGAGERGGGSSRRPGFRNELVWRYGLGGSSRRAWPRKHDTILWYTRGTSWYFDPPMVPATSARMKGMMKKHPDVLDIPAINNMARERTGYPTQKPLALLRLLVRAHAPQGGLVVDPCCGSGTSLVAARETGRVALGGDLSPEAVTIAGRRLAELLAGVCGSGD
ncbi:MAG: site-specific DNA-methyltransferase [Deltaproteobacteria bacterium]|nr:MAG: site-specific DNA-methyltransferase [Deltaproteobacteria bacterium]